MPTNKPQVAFDLETTGLDPLTAEIVELGIADMNGSTTRRYRPLKPIPEEASSVHGIRDENVASCGRFIESALRVSDYLRQVQTSGRELIAYNGTKYDVPCLNAEAARAVTYCQLDPAQVLDPLVFAKWHMRHLPSRKLVDVALELIDDVHTFRAHNAGDDASLAIRISHRMRDIGWIPEDTNKALDMQAELAFRIDAEWKQWKYWLWSSRLNGELMVGCGRQNGVPLNRADKGWIRSCLKIDDLPPDVRLRFQLALT